MKNKALKLSLGAVAAVALTMVAVACDGAEGDNGETPTTKTYAVTYDLNNGTGTVPTQSALAEGTTFTLASADGFSYEGYVFDGWHDGTTKYNAGATYTMPGKAVTFTAQWKLEDDDGTTYTITYDLNGGTGTLPTEANKAAGATFVLAASTGLTKTGFTFDGWHDGTTKYEAGATYTMPEKNVTLTAQWVLAPGIDLPDEIIEYTGDCTLPVKDGYLGEKGGEHIVGIAIDSENEELYYKIKDGIGWIKSAAKYYEITNKQHMPDKYGADAHYYEGKIGELNYYALVKPDFSELTLCDTDDNILDGGVFTMNVTAPLEVTVTFDLGYSGYGVENPKPQTFANGGKATAPEAPTRANYTFGGWHVGTADGELFTFDTPVTSNMTLVAKWIADAASYTITFTAPEDATGTAPATITVDAGAQYTVPVNTFTKTGWEFYKWKNTATGSYVSESAKYVATKNVEYVAVFKKSYSYIDPEDYYYSGATLTICDDGTLEFNDGYDTNHCDYIDNDGVISFEIINSYGSLYYAARIDTATGKFEIGDGLHTVNVTANDGTTKLALDGFGGAKLGEYIGTYVYEYGSTVDVVFDGNTFTLTIVYDGSSLISGFEGKITVGGTTYTFGTTTPDPDPEPDPDPDDSLTGKLSDYLGENNAAVKYGYSNATEAADNKLSVTNSSGVEHGYYYAQVSYNTNSNKYSVYLYRSSFTSIGGPTWTKDADGNAIEDIDAKNQKLYVSNNSYDKPFEITFSMVDGKRTMTIKCGDTTVTWTEMA